MKRQRTKDTPQIEPRALAFIAGTGAAVVALAFRPWIDFKISQLKGTDADAITNVGEGYVVIALAVAAIIFAAGVYLRPGNWNVLLPGIGLAAIGIAAIAAYDAAQPWHAIGSDANGAFIADGHATAELYAIIGVAAAMGIAAATLAGLHYQRLGRETTAGEEHTTTKGPRHDQTNTRASGRLGPR